MTPDELAADSGYKMDKPVHFFAAGFILNVGGLTACGEIVVYGHDCYTISPIHLWEHPGGCEGCRERIPEPPPVVMPGDDARQSALF